MSSDTLRSRIAHLLRKSQKAVYLYSHSTVSHSTVLNDRSDSDKRFKNVQVLVWKRVNEELSQSLRLLLRVQSLRELSQRALALREELYENWRRLEAELHVKRTELLQSAESDQFVKSTLLAEKLVTLKARVQAARAALNEFESATGDIVSMPDPGLDPLLSVMEEDEGFRLADSEEGDGDGDDGPSNVLPFPDARRSFR